MLPGPDFNGDGKVDIEDGMIYDLIDGEPRREELEERAKIVNETSNYRRPQNYTKVRNKNKENKSTSTSLVEFGKFIVGLLICVLIIVVTIALVYYLIKFLF
ncbi:hypothetical protein BGI41_03370 [Methanobrevibacter sp. 87.7]|uniref:hypothetical protein n=1 Tax=Methanobrevibacter sp. 87.7 TaxID=387957 RepID=UPI000B507E6D|nr:hypothetical protein [Methanobrevibacter sp. 87.7]OWT33255.1 hypothetical protein BGI41_03370 [Methanobrevibacter sp. 87.7]